MVTRLGMTRVETMEIVQSIAIGPLEVVCGARCCGHYIVLYCDLIIVEKNIQIKV